MALQGPFIQNSDSLSPGSPTTQLHQKALFKVIKASIVASDYEVIRPTESKFEVVEFVTSYSGQGVVMVYVDQVAYKNRAIPVGSFFVDFLATPESTTNSLLQLAYEAIPKTLNAPSEEYEIV